ncbi:MAG: response regulator [Pseudomonadota bacterium]
MPKLLIVDDETIIRENLSIYLEDEGFEPFEASTAEDALIKMRFETFDCIIVDLRLPGKDGVEFINQAFELYRFNRFIIHTGSAEFRMPKSFFEMGMSAENILQKPVQDMSVFKDKIESLLKAFQ